MEHITVKLSPDSIVGQNIFGIFLIKESIYSDFFCLYTNLNYLYIISRMLSHHELVKIFLISAALSTDAYDRVFTRCGLPSDIFSEKFVAFHSANKHLFTVSPWILELRGGRPGRRKQIHRSR